MKLKDQLSQIISNALKKAKIDAEEVIINEAGRAQFGDYQYNGAMALAKKLGQNPREIATKIASHIPIGEMIAKCEVAGPGFVNIWLDEEWIANKSKELIDDKRLGIENTTNPSTIVVDYSSPNMAKEMHVGHLRSTIIGDTLSNLFEFLGDNVIRQNHIGDWGTQFGMLIAYLEETGSNGGAKLSDLEQFYKDAKKRFDSDEDFADTAREYVVKLQSGDEKCLRLWNDFINTSLSHCEEVYSKLGVKLTREDVKAESSYNDDLEDVIKTLEKKGLLSISDGAKCIFLDEEKPPFIVQKKDGGYLYATTDLAAIRHRVQTLEADRISYVVDARQSEHFRQLFEVARKAGFAGPDTHLEHVSFGMMLDKSGKPFKTRDGGTIKLIDLLEEAVSRAKDAITQREQYSDDELDHIAEVVGIGAVKYADLSIHRDSNYIFDWDKMLSLNGNTSLYLQYAYARIRSILRKHDKEIKGDIILQDPLERALALKLLRFEDTLTIAASESLPHYITTYLYETATLFMKFYENCPILRDDIGEDTRQSRLLLSRLTAQTIKTGLGLLGIGVLDRL